MSKLRRRRRAAGRKLAADFRQDGKVALLRMSAGEVTLLQSHCQFELDAESKRLCVCPGNEVDVRRKGVLEESLHQVNLWTKERSNGHDHGRGR